MRTRQINGLIYICLLATVVYGQSGQKNTHWSGLKITHYDLDLRITPAQSKVDASLTIDYTASAGQDTVEFLLTDQFKISHSSSSVKSRTENGPTEKPWTGLQRIRFYFPRPLRRGDRVRFDFRYAGRLNPAKLQWKQDSISPEWIELSLNSMWFPMLDGLRTPLTAEARVSGLSGRMRLVSSGKSMRKGNIWLVRNTNPQVDIVLAASPVFDYLKSGAFEVYSAALKAPATEILKEVGPKCVAYFNDLFGGVKRLSSAKVVISPRTDHGGYARQGLVVLFDNKGQSRLESVMFVCHEFAHFWWNTADDDGMERWLDESLAEFSTMRFVRDHIDIRDYAALIEDKSKRAARSSPVITGGKRPEHVAMYQRGPLVLSRLEERIGPKMMDGLLIRLAGKKRLDTSEFLNELERTAGKSVRDETETALKQDLRNVR